MHEIRKNAKVTWVAPDPWTSPDGKVTISTIKLETNGETDTLSTMSKALATVGWTGDVEIYTNDKGKTYVRQAPKDEHAKPNESFSDGMAWGNALNNATQLTIAFSPKDMSLGDAVKRTIHAAELLVSGRSVEEKPQEKSGYEKAKEVAESLKPEYGDDQDILTGEPIDLADIPF